MILNHSQNLLFIHNIKTAGKAVRNSIDQTIPYIDWYKSKITYKLGLKNRYSALWFGKCFPHVSAECIQKYLGESYFDKLFKFGVMRNPETWAFSAYRHWHRTYYRGQEHNYNFRISCFEDFLERWASRFPPSQLYQFSLLSGNWGCNSILLFEKLSEAWSNLRKKYSLVALEKINVSPSDESKIIGNDAISLVREIFPYDYEIYESLKKKSLSETVNLPTIPNVITDNLKKIRKTGNDFYDPWSLGFTFKPSNNSH